jgi:hypothetical protein
MTQQKPILQALAGERLPIFNLGHGITSDAEPKSIHLMLKALRC